MKCQFRTNGKCSSNFKRPEHTKGLKMPILFSITKKHQTRAVLVLISVAAGLASCAEEALKVAGPVPIFAASLANAPKRVAASNLNVLRRLLELILSAWPCLRVAACAAGRSAPAETLGRPEVDADLALQELPGASSSCATHRLSDRNNREMARWTVLSLQSSAMSNSHWQRCVRPVRQLSGRT